MYALLAGCHNLGNSGANMLGAYALEFFDVTPAGRRNGPAGYLNWRGGGGSGYRPPAGANSPGHRAAAA